MKNLRYHTTFLFALSINLLAITAQNSSNLTSDVGLGPNYSAKNFRIENASEALENDKYSSVDTSREAVSKYEAPRSLSNEFPVGLIERANYSSTGVGNDYIYTIYRNHQGGISLLSSKKRLRSLNRGWAADEEYKTNGYGTQQNFNPLSDSDLRDIWMRSGQSRFNSDTKDRLRVERVFGVDVDTEGFYNNGIEPANVTIGLRLFNF